ncbi:MAG: T9SS type A sorting domain-containing protein, partial [Rhodothermia bacterium]
SETRMFTVVRLLSAVDLTSPENGAAGVTPYAAFAWAGLEGAASYEVEVSSNRDFTSLILADTTSGTQYTLDAPLTYESTYYWRVRGVNTSGPGEWSDTWSFAVAVGTATEDPADVPTATRLLQPYPNPATTTVTIPFELVEPASITIDVFDIAGRLSTVIKLGPLSPGPHTERIDVAGWRSGAYVIVLRGKHPSRQFLFIMR